jgi:protein ImuB
VPLGALDLSVRIAETFVRWGVRTLGDLARLPRDGVAARLGEEGLAAHDAAAGLDTAPFRPYLAPPFWEEAQSLDWEIDALDALVRLLEGVLARLVARLAAAHVLAGELDVHLDLVSGGRHARTLALAHPLGEVAPMLTLIRLDLERHPPGAAVTRIAVSAHPVRPRVVQPRLGEAVSPSVRDLAAVLARLAAVAGADAVGSPRALDTHRPDAFTVVPFAPPADVGPGAGAGDTAPLALRRLRPPRPADVETERAGDEARPLRVRLPPASRVERVMACAGPWRRSGAWWDSEGWARDEWDAVLGDGLLCRLVHDRLTGHWYLDAVYD